MKQNQMSKADALHFFIGYIKLPMIVIVGLIFISLDLKKQMPSALVECDIIITLSEYVTQGD